ncbi:hypothetical protein ACA910_005118 [Epithemia clementina (nom. ined.)]
MADLKLLIEGLKEATQKTEYSVIQAIKEHVSSPDFSPDQGVDFLRTKNSLFLTYLIELTNKMRTELLSVPPSESSGRRFDTMKVVLDKSRGLEKKLRYQIDKLISSGTTSTSFATAEDPLHSRPNTSAFLEDDEQAENIGNDKGDDESDASNSEKSAEDADLEAARATVAKIRRKTSPQNETANSETEESDGIYRAPRLAAVPYNIDKVDRKAEKEKRQLRQMRASELAQALRSQFGEGPEQEDIHGGSELGRQREASKRFERLQEDKRQYEESAMVRLTVTRKEKKERKRLLREESSNLAAIADLGNIMRDAALGGKERKQQQDSVYVAPPEAGTNSPSGRKRKDRWADESYQNNKRSSKKSLTAKNQLQAALFGGDTSKSKKSKQSRKRS